MPSIEDIKSQIERYQQEGKRLFLSSSFQSHSIPLLHVISQIDKSIPVYFLDTGFHFPETLTFRDEIADLLHIQVINLRSVTPRNRQLNEQGNLLYTSDPDYCCYLNKIAPIEPLLQQFDVWINGVRADQNANRASFGIEQKTAFRAIRYHPFLDWSQKMIYQYINKYALPSHPLEAKGYVSIGCEPCTRHLDAFKWMDERGGRWFGMQKTECGLHTDLIQKA